MLSIPINPVPNQSVSFNADGAFWTVRIYMSVLYMVADVSINGVPIIQGVRCFGGIGLLPYAYMRVPGYGNLVFDSDANWINFGSGCNLFYLEDAEYDEFVTLMMLGAVSV